MAVQESVLVLQERLANEQKLVQLIDRIHSAKTLDTIFIEIHRIDPASEKRQIERTRELKRRRDQEKVKTLLDRLEKEARDPAVNLMPVTIELVKARATMGEIVARLKQVHGTYTETPVF